VVIVEGAGSPAEPNLRAGDIANMGFAEAADIPVWIVGDIDCGGVFASLTGTLAILSTSEQARVQALLINRFRGYRSLLDDGLTWLEQSTGKPVAGVMPWLPLQLPEEDAPYRLGKPQAKSQATLQIAVLMYPRVSNLDDIDPLAAEPSVALRLINRPEDLQPADVLILPGSKHTAADLAWLREMGFEQAINKHLRYGGKLLGLCGGMQMLGQTLVDEAGALQGELVAGLGLLPIHTKLQATKTLKRLARQAIWPKPVWVTGYEIHYGNGPEDEELFPFSHISSDDAVWGTYVHGLFESGDFRQAWLFAMGAKQADNTDHEARVMASLDLLADALEEYIQPELLKPLFKRGSQS